MVLTVLVHALFLAGVSLWWAWPESIWPWLMVWAPLRFWFSGRFHRRTWGSKSNVCSSRGVLGVVALLSPWSASADSWVPPFQFWIVSIGLILVVVVNFSCLLLKARVDLWIDDLSGWSRGLFLSNRMGLLDLGLLPFTVGYWARIGL